MVSSLLLIIYLTFAGSNGLLWARNTVSNLNIVVDVNINTDTDIVDITISGPDNRWFGIGFGNTVMLNIYTITAEGTNTVRERKLGAHTAGTILSSSITVISDSVQSSVRTITIKRNRVGNDGDYYTFPITADDINIIWAYGVNSGSTSFASHGPGSTYSGSTLTTLSFIPTSAILGVKDTFADPNIVVDLIINTGTDIVDITISGADDRWFGIGFGNNMMFNTYTITAEGATTVNERKLGNHNGGTILSQSINVLSDSVQSSLRNVTIRRDRVGNSGDYYTFPTTSGDINIILAHGANVGSTTFASHGPGSTYRADTLSLTATTAIVYEKTVSNQNIIVQLTINTDTDIVDITISGPDDRWFGIGFGNNVMLNTYVITAEGTNSVNERKLGDHVSGTVLSSSITVLSDFVQSTVRTIIIRRNRVGNNGDYYTFPITGEDINIIWAYGANSGSTTFASHGPGDTYGVSVLALETTPQPTTAMPTINPTTLTPTNIPTHIPTTLAPTNIPTTLQPTKQPTKQPTLQPTKQPTKQPTNQPTKQPSNNPTNQPTKPPTNNPITSKPTSNPITLRPTVPGQTRDPTAAPSIYPTTSTPTTAIPTTSIPTTGIPTTDNPTTAMPTTAMPTSNPITQRPTTNEPTTSQPTTAMPTTGIPTTDNPTTAMPTTAMPTTASEYTTCATQTLLGGKATVTLRRKASDKTMQITITGPIDKWFAFGFGTSKMEGSYAVAASGSTFDVSEHTLPSSNNAGIGSTVGPSGTVTKKETTTREFTLTRPYAYDGTFDFTQFMECNGGSIDIIAAAAEDKIDFGYHGYGTSYRDSTTLSRTCTCDPTGDDPTNAPTNNPTSAPVTQQPTSATTASVDDTGSANNIFTAFYISVVMCFALYFMA